MIELPDGSVIMQQGEALPAYCRPCERYYPVPLHSEISDCPFCGRTTLHAQTEFDWLAPEEETHGEST